MTDTNNPNMMYGLDNDTPLFTKLAESEIKNGNYEKAIKLLQYGIRKYPNYPSPYFLYGKALLTLGKIREAEEAFQTGIDLIGFKDTTEFYTSLIPEIKEEIHHETIEENLPKEEEKVVPQKEEETESVLVEEIHDDKTDEIVVASEPEEQDVDLEDLANKLSSAKMDMPRDREAKVQPEKESEPKTSSSPRGLVSETLARIYVSQENYKEAIEIYETLIEIQPEREDYYRKKLEEIEMKRGNKS